MVSPFTMISISNVLPDWMKASLGNSSAFKLLQALNFNQQIVCFTTAEMKRKYVMRYRCFLNSKE